MGDISENKSSNVSIQPLGEEDVMRIVANVTHELKTPLHAILSTAALLKGKYDGPLTKEQEHQVDIIVRNGESLLETISSLLSYSSTATDTRKRNISKVHFSKNLRLLVEELKPIGDISSIKVNMEHSGESYFYTDFELVERIVRNIVGNSLKFSSAGDEIQVSSEVSIKHGIKTLLLQIADTGKGMDDETKNNVFIPFFQGDATSTRVQGGVGLGMSLVKNAVRQLEGSIKVQSEPNKGTLFTIELPDLESEFVRKRVVVSESRESLTHALCLLLEDDFDVDSVMREKLIENLMSERPELVILDLDEDHSGVSIFETLSDIKSYVDENKIPILGLSAVIDLGERSKAYALGVSDVLVKPFNSDDLLAKIRLLTT